MGYFRANSIGKNIEGTNEPRLFTSGYLGLTSCTIPLVGPKQQPRTYTVRLGFRAPAGDKRDQRIFDVKLQDKVVLKNLDVTQDAGQSDKALVKELSAIQVIGDLKLELIPQNGNPRKQQAPNINSVEIIEEFGS